MGSEAIAGGRAIVTFSRSWQALAAVRSLGARGVEVITGDEIALTPGALSRYSVDSFVYPNPAVDEAGFLGALEEAIERFRPPSAAPYVLMPVHRETYVIARHRERFASRIGLVLPPPGAIEEVRDKGRLMEIARDVGLDVPPTWAPRSTGQLEDWRDEIEPPVLVKVRTGVAGVGIEKAETRDEMVAIFDRLAAEVGPGEDPPIVQQLLPGEDYCVSALFDSGEARATLTYRNLRSLVEGAPGAVRKTVAAPEPEQAAIRLLEALDWHGIAEIDFLWTGRSGDPAYLIEINPRMFGGMFQAIASNVDYPWMLYRLALGHPVEAPRQVDLEVTTEAPVVGFLATLREAVETAAGWATLERAWEEAREHLATGALGAGLKRLLAGLREEPDNEGRLAALRTLLEERQTTVSQLFSGNDPRAAIGLLYPLAVFLRQGRIDPGVLVGAKPIERDPGPEPS